ncbi:MAG: nucleoside 2-deoxyribosyltransferase [Anaerolineae bacterium]
MKIYFAGPLFTPYVRQFISEHAQILREHGIDPFVPHENFWPKITAENAKMLVEKGLLTAEELHDEHLPARAARLLRSGKVSREELGLPDLDADLVFQKDYEGLSAANAVVAILDGTQVDDGTACEIGIFYGLLRDDPSKKGVIGFMTDSRGTRRAKEGFGVNLFVLGVIEECGVILTDFDDVIEQLKAWDSA